MATYSGIKQSVATAAGVGGGGLDVYATIDDLPTSGLTAGDQAYITATSRLYVSNGSGWYNIGLVNATPTLTIDPTGTIVLSTSGETTTITLTATDSDNSVAGLTYSVDSDGSFAGLGTISQDSSVFTITPLSSANATTTTAALTFKAFDGINFGSGVASISLNFKLEYSNYTSFLLQTDDTATDNQVDASTNNYTITEYGNVTSTAVTPHHPGGYSVYFDGTGDSLQLTTSGDLQAIGRSGTAATIEAWVFLNSAPSSDGTAVYSQGTAGSTSGSNIISFEIQNNRTLRAMVNGGYSNTSGCPISTGTVPLQEWTHIALVLNSGTWTIYINGTADGTASGSYPSGTAHSTAYIGRTFYDAVRTGDMYIRDLRITSTAVYTSAFTPPDEKLTAITNTKLLACHLPYIGDGSTSNYTITVTGDPSIERFNPYEYAGYRKANDGGSVYFDGSGDNFTVADGLNLGTDDFTFEFWIYPDENFTSVAKQFINTEISGTGTGWAFVQSTYAGYNGLNFTYGSYGAYTVGKYINNYWLPQRQWTHLAAQRRSGTIEIYVNGVSKTLTTYNEGGTFSDSANLTGTQAYRTFFDGVKAYVSDVRLVTGSYVYNGDFTPPTVPLTAITNTKLLTCTNKNSVWDKTGISATELVGTAAASTTQTKYASSSVYLDGNSDYVSVPESDQLDMGSEDFTVEAWVYPVATAVNYPTFIGTVTGWTGGSSSHRFDNAGQAGKFSFHLNPHDPLVTTTNTFTHDQWYHYVLTRSEGQYQLYVNGNFEASAASTLTYNAAFGGMRIGNSAWDGGNGYFSGYVSDARITRGLSRYPFIPVKETLTADTNTVLLTCHDSTVTTAASGTGATTSNLSTTGDPTTTTGPGYNLSAVDFDGNDNLVIPNGNTDLGAIDGAFTIEGWVNFDAAPPGTGGGNERHIVGQSSWPESSGGDWWVVYAVSTGIYWYTAGGGGYLLTQFPTFTWETGKWYHFALTRDASDAMGLFLNGTYLAPTSNATNGKGILATNGRAFSIGADDNASHNGMDGKISNLRISNIVRYTKNFTPPTSELLG